MEARIDSEKVYRYPRAITSALNTLVTLAVALTIFWLGCHLLEVLYIRYGVDTALFARFPFLQTAATAMRAIAPINSTPELILPLAVTALVLLFALLTRSSFPTLRSGPRGLLVEFAGSWLAVPWESIKTIKVTEANERYVLLVETDRARLTGWHIAYSFIYRLGQRPGFLISSHIDQFDELVRTILNETDRVARVLGNVKAAQMREDAVSPLFRLLLSPTAFLAQRSTPAVDAPAAPELTGQYPPRLALLLEWLGRGLIVLAVLRALVLLAAALTRGFPDLQRYPPFSLLDLRTNQEWWWLALAALVVLVVLVPIGQALRHLLPGLEARADGLMVRYGALQRLIGWNQISAVKVTELSEANQIVLIEARAPLPWYARLSSLLYDGGTMPAILATSAMRDFEPLLQRIILDVMRNPTAGASSDAPIFRSDARSAGIWMVLNSSEALDKIVAEHREDSATLQIDRGRLWRAALTMLPIALFPALLLLADRTLLQGVVPDLRLLSLALVIFGLGMIEWPLTAIAATVLDEAGQGGGEEGNRALYLYPSTQVPRVLLLAGAVIAAMLGIVILPMVLWIGAIVLSFWLAAGLWSTLFDWRGGQLVTGGLIPVLFQLFVLIGFLLVRG